MPSRFLPLRPKTVAKPKTYNPCSTPYLDEALEELYRATVGIEQWRSLREICVGTKNHSVKLTEEARGTLADLRDALKDIAYNLQEIRLRGTGDIPHPKRSASESKRKTAVLIASLSDAIYCLWKHLQYSRDQADLKELNEVLMKIQDISRELEHALNSGSWLKDAVQRFDTRNSKIDGFAKTNSNNTVFAPSGCASQRFKIDNSVLEGSGESLLNTGNVDIVMTVQNPTVAEMQDALACARMPASAQQQIAGLFDFMMSNQGSQLPALTTQTKQDLQMLKAVFSRQVTVA